MEDLLNATIGPRGPLDWTDAGHLEPWKAFCKNILILDLLIHDLIIIS